MEGSKVIISNNKINKSQNRISRYANWTLQQNPLFLLLFVYLGHCESKYCIPRLATRPIFLSILHQIEGPKVRMIMQFRNRRRGRTDNTLQSFHKNTVHIYTGQTCNDKPKGLYRTERLPKTQNKSFININFWGLLECQSLPGALMKAVTCVMKWYVSLPINTIYHCLLQQ